MQDLIDNYYFHIPFCNSICYYCGFVKQLKNKSEEDKFIPKILNDIKSIKTKVKTIYIGGGTPSSLDNNHIQQMMDEFEKLSYQDNYEFTFECNPEDVNEELLKILSQSKVNRISIGIQSFDGNELKMLGRNHDDNKAIDAIELLQKYFDNISVDLMFGFKGQTKETFLKNIELIKKYKIKHVSLYNLIIKENTKFSIDDETNIENDEVIELQENFAELTGLHRYEIANYSIKGFESKHNLNTWDYGKYIGYGYGACSNFNGHLWEQQGELTNYKNTQTEKLYELDDYINTFMLGLRKTEGVDIIKHKDAYNHFKTVIEANMKYFDMSETHIWVKTKYLSYLNEVILIFMD